MLEAFTLLPKYEIALLHILHGYNFGVLGFSNRWMKSSSARGEERKHGAFQFGSCKFQV